MYWIHGVNLAASKSDLLDRGLIIELQADIDMISVDILSTSGKSLKK